MPHQDSHISVEIFYFLVDQHYLTRKKNKINTSLEMVPPFNPSSSEKMLHGPTQLESAGLSTTEVSCLEPKRPHLSNQMYNHSENKKMRIPPHSTFFLFADINRHMTYLKTLCDAF